MKKTILLINLTFFIGLSNALTQDILKIGYATKIINGNGKLPDNKKKQGPIINFENEICDVDTIREGSRCEVFFKFQNIGNKPLIINVKGNFPTSYDKKPILPGQWGMITGTLYTKGHSGNFYKSITVRSNSKVNGIQLLYAKGFIDNTKNIKPD